MELNDFTPGQRVWYRSAMGTVDHPAKKLVHVRFGGGKMRALPPGELEIIRDEPAVTALPNLTPRTTRRHTRHLGTPKANAHTRRVQARSAGYQDVSRMMLP